jgi:CTP:molybdopterin cytidylyltransferase MocA
VIVAAGRSSRMGTPKAAIEIDGEPVLVRLARIFVEAGLDPLIVVASGEAMDVALDIQGAVLVEGDPDAPMIDSIAHGIDRAGPLPVGAVIQPVDAFYTSKEMVAALLDGAMDGAKILAHGGVAGHPVYAPRSTFEAIRARPEGGLREVLETSAAAMIEFADKRVLADIDTPEELERWSKNT